jgi:DNA-binding transcriptional ArsR family regulator
VSVTEHPDIETTARLFHGLGHAVRLRVILALEAGPLSPSQLDERLGVGLSLVAYHVRALRDDGFLELVETRAARGSIESFYRLSPRGRWAHEVLVAARRGIVGGPHPA